MPAPKRPATSSATVAAALTVGALLAGCGSSAQPLSSARSTTTASPESAGAAQTRDVVVTLTALGCTAAASTYRAGPLSFKVTNQDATAVSEFELLSGARILGEKENLPPGFSGSFSLRLEPGSYTMYCPGAATEKTPFVVTGTSQATTVDNTHGLLATGAKQYAQYVTRQARQLVDSVRPLVRALRGDNLTAAQDAYMRARSAYEHIEPVAESFTIGKQNLDANIDARAGDVPASQWQGFHYIERGLFQTRSLAGLAPYGDRLLVNVEKLHTLVLGLSYQPAELANGSLALLDEVARTKISGEEERYSHIDLLDFQANVEGSQQAFACLRPGLATIDRQLASTVGKAFSDLQRLLDSYRSTSNAAGFVLYGALPDAGKTRLSSALQAVAEPLSRVAGKVVGR